MTSEPWGRAQWERLADGQVFDGMESWLPWLHPASTFSPTCCRRRRRSCWSSRAGLRDRAVELVDEEGALAEHAGHHVGRAGDAAAERSCPRLHLAVRPAAGERAAPVLSMLPVAEGPDARRSPCRGFDAGRRRRRAGWPSSCVALVGPAGTGRAVHAEGRRRADRLADVLAEEGVVAAACPSDADGSPRGVTGRRRRRSPAGFVAARRPAGGPGRVRRHRPAPPAPPARAPGPADRRFLRRPGAGQLRRAPPARRRPLRAAWRPAPSAGRPATTCVLEYRGERPAVPAGRPDRGGHAVHGRRDPDAVEDGRGRLAADPGAGPGRGRRDRRRSSSSSTGAGPASPGHAFAPDTPVAARDSRPPSPTPRRPTSCGPSPR